MLREEKRKKFHEAVLKTLYPPPSPPESEEEEEKKPVITSERPVNFGLENPDDFEESKSSSSTTDNEDGGRSQAETQTLSRAQRKRLRKKKVKEDAFRRGKMIGPLLPLSEKGIGSLQDEPEGVRENAAHNQVASSDKHGNEQGGCSSKKKLKQRRIAKSLARDGLKSTETGNSDQGKERQLI